MKIASVIVIVLASVMVIFNATKIDSDAPFNGDSMIAVITIMAGLCAILLMVILRISKRIEQKVKEQK
jgi:integral membrane sensor domain MASE1